MTPTTETELTPELLERVMKLSAENKDKLIGLILDDRESESDDREAVRDELTRRWEQYKRGTERTYTLDEVVAYLRAQQARRGG